ncbi:hypothetical protein ACFSKL_09470 [Belliella marina]|uniref:Peptide-N(4)-(N-acetyl-beta-glucosaminyl)asparagine amidase n=1 Tax=Belliella marina TaxID=1644146 RepID=A0ABW4VMJ3_9BACT
MITDKLQELLNFSGLLMACSFGVLSLLSSCNYPKEVELVLAASESNREELEKVIEYFSESENKEKLKAAYFLISNMHGKYWLDGEEKDKYSPLFDTIDSLWQAGERVNFDHKVQMSEYWEALKIEKGYPNVVNANLNSDILSLNSETLISHIEQAFLARETLTWCKDLPFDDFCEFVLPFRIGAEKPEPWNKILWEKWQVARDTMPNANRMEISEIINNHNAFHMHHMALFWEYPFDMSASEFEKVRLGSCKHSVFYTAMAMRANGLPVGVDFVPQWAGSNAGHEWNILLKEDGIFHPFDAVNKGFELDLSFRKVAKVFRKTYTPQQTGLDKQDLENLPPSFRDLYRIDVTHEYVKTFDVEIFLDQVPQNTKHAIIATFNNKEWAPQYWGEIKGGKATFKNMGSNIAYVVMDYRQGRSELLTEPFILDSLGKIIPLAANESQLQEMRLTRKYPLTSFMEGIMGFVVGNKFQGANQRDFSDSVTLFTIEKTPLKIETAKIHDTNKYRYVRMWIPPGGRGDMAEIEFYGTSDSGQNTKLKGNIIGDPKADISEDRFFSYPFDGNLLTYFMRPKQIEPWVGLDLGKPERITKIRYCPRSDTNFIEVDDLYELFYWKKGEWISMGVQTASDQEIMYQSVPSGGLYLLKNKSKGNEERIFTYENNQQLWW